MLIMNHDQLQKTLHASQYAEQVLAQYAEQLQQDDQDHPFHQTLSSAEIFAYVEQTLAGIEDEIQWMRQLRILRARLMFRWIWQDAN